MSDQPETYQRISVPEAAAILGVSVATVRRRIRDGSLRAEPIHRPQGIAYAVLLATDHATNHERSSSDQQVGTTARLNQSQVPPAEAIAAMIQATLTPIIGPLVAEQAALRLTVERQADQLVKQAGTIGRLEAELAAERQKSSLVAPTAAGAPDLPLRAVHAAPPAVRALVAGPTDSGHPRRGGVRALAVAVSDGELLGERLRRLRETRGMTRSELARSCIALGRRTDRAEIIRYEEGAYYPRLPTFAALAEALGVSLDVLWYGEEEAEWLAWEHEQQHSGS